jgi:uncharacterized membrane protein
LGAAIEAVSKRVKHSTPPEPFTRVVQRLRTGAIQATFFNHLSVPSGDKVVTLDPLEFATLVVTGFTSCAEFGSYAFVHPVIRRLPPEHHVAVEKGLLKTFGRVMPVLMTLSVVLSIGYAIRLGAVVDAANAIRWCSASVFVAALVSTIVFNVPINLATGQWNPQNPPRDWKKIRNRWEFFQGVRSWLLLAGFLLLCLAVAARH